MACGAGSPGGAGTGGDAGSAAGTTGVAGTTGAAGTTGGAGTTGAAGGRAGRGGAGVAGRGGAAGSGGTGGGAGTGGGGGGGSGASDGTCPGGGWAAGDQTITLPWGGVNRQYVVHVPPGYTGTTRVPLMLTIHGAHNTPALARSWSQMNPVADQNGFVVAYPAALDCWSSGPALPGCTMADDDVGFLSLVVSDIKAHACIDPRRVYAAGISNGAMMAQRLACQRADVFAAVGGIAGPLGFSPCTPARAIAIAYFHGTEDRTVGYASAQPTVNGWATRNGCTGSPVQTYSMGSTTCVTHQNCRDGVEVVFGTITGMGHCWPEDSNCGPGGGPSFGVTDFKASPFMWEFFNRHPLP